MERQFDITGWLAAAVFLAGLFGLVYGLPEARPPAPVSAQTAQRPVAQTTDEKIALASPQFLGVIEFDSWALRCQEVVQDQARPDESGGAAAPGERVRVCRVNHVVRSPTTPGTFVAGINVFRSIAAEQTNSILFVRLPPETQQGEITFLVDANDGYKAPIARCTEKECLMQTVVSDAFIKQMADGAILRFIVPVADGTKNRFDVPLEGFAAANEALSRSVVR